MSSHAMARDAHPQRIQLTKLRTERLRQLFRDVAVHAIAIAPGLARGIDVEPGSGPKVPCVVLAGDVQAA